MAGYPAIGLPGDNLTFHQILHGIREGWARPHLVIAMPGQINAVLDGIFTGKLHVLLEQYMRGVFQGTYEGLIRLRFRVVR